tara:strand:+ start:248 stop:460 length:213 start_codon:yes stop_codon:yes gene_type:complete
MDSLFNLKYSEEVVDLFLKFKEISKNHGSTLFKKPNVNSDQLMEFLEKNTYLSEKEIKVKENDLLIDDNY